MNLTKKQRKRRNRIAVALILFVLIYAAVELLPLELWLGSPAAVLYLEFALFLVPYLIAGHDVLLRAARNIKQRQIFDENFLMAVATIGAFGLVFFPNSDPHMAEGAAVMLFYQVGELFQDYAVNKSRKSIADMMDIAPEYANIVQDGQLTQVDPYQVNMNDHIMVRPGERVPLDGVVLEGNSQLDTAALTGESTPRCVSVGEEVFSGCINLTGVLTIRVTKPYGESTVARILELVENASEKKAHTESFITRFARYYTPVVVIAATLLAVAPPLLLGQPWADWIQRGLIFLVVSCPCALVISIPMSFFGGIGGASRLGILVKGSNYLEALAKVDTVVFDKTGTLTSGTFQVVDIQPAKSFTTERVLKAAAYAESYSSHPIATSVVQTYNKPIDQSMIREVHEQSGFGVLAQVDRENIVVGNNKLMLQEGITPPPCSDASTVLHIAINNTYAGYILIADTIKSDAHAAIKALHTAGVRKVIMLTGDRFEVAQDVCNQLGLDAFHAQLLPQDKVEQVERLLHEESAGHKLAFVGDGINDAPVLTRADVGIAMGAMGSDAAIEAADVVLMDDRPSNIARAIRVARKTMCIVRQNIIFALGVKFAVLILATFGLANMWLAVFADVGVAVLAILNAMRCMNTNQFK